ncbi:MAG: ribonuclease P protein component [Candidatus Promineifilaceae bacterium]|nr:ribonuclease P protein component [Candidatus Promineifilaceae bacterium]
MLSKRFRLRKRSDVMRVRRMGQRYRHPLAILLVAPSPAAVKEKADSSEMSGRDGSRFAVVASRRVGSAVTRNRAKRLLREALRSQLGQIEPGWDGMLIARQATAHAGYVEVERAVATLLARADILTGQRSI